MKRLLPEEIREQEWALEIASFKPAICHFEVFLGFEGDIARHGATRSNHWFYQNWDTDKGIWTVADGAPIPGFTLEECDVVYGDHIDRPMAWRGRTEVKQLVGRPVRLRFVLSDADIFSLRFR